MDEPLQNLTVTANDYAGRKGFDETTSWASPTSATSGRGGGRPAALHALLGADARLDKRLAAVAGVGIDGSMLMDLDQAGISWELDPRLPAGQQTGERVYAPWPCSDQSSFVTGTILTVDGGKLAGTPAFHTRNQ